MVVMKEERGKRKEKVPNLCRFGTLNVFIQSQAVAGVNNAHVAAAA